MNWLEKSVAYYADHYMDGMVLSRPDCWQKLCSDRGSSVLIRKSFRRDHFGILISGGGANGPMFPGFVWDGLADAAAVGGPYSAPNAYILFEAAKYLGENNGVLLIYNNFSGDWLNNDMACELLKLNQVPVESVVVHDDIASAAGAERGECSGCMGMLFLLKIASLFAESGMPLAEAAQLLRRAEERIGTLNLQIDVQNRTVYYGRGISGEPEIDSLTNTCLEAAVQKGCDMLLRSLCPKPEERVYVLVNRMRLSSYSDSYRVVQIVHRYLSERCNLASIHCGNYSNVLDICGYDLSLFCAQERFWPGLERLVQAECFSL